MKMANPTNWVPNDSRMPVNLFSPGKNSAGKTSAAAVP